MLEPLLSQVAVKRLGRGRPRMPPDAVLGDKAYSSGVIRAKLRSCGIQAVIPQPMLLLAVKADRAQRCKISCQANPTRLNGSRSQSSTSSASRSSKKAGSCLAVLSISRSFAIRLP